jgi:hypothetical protein
MRLAFSLLLGLALASCGSEEDEVPAFAVGGTVAGMTGRGLVLFMKGEYLDVPSDGEFVFETRIEDGDTYSVAVAEQPTAPRQVCTLANARGTVDGADVNDVAVTCIDAIYAIGGTVSGLEGDGLLLQNNGREVLAVDANGPFTFAIPVEDGSAYDVRVFAQPSDPDQTCAVSRGTGRVVRADVSNVAVDCTTP